MFQANHEVIPSLQYAFFCLDHLFHCVKARLEASAVKGRNVRVLFVRSVWLMLTNVCTFTQCGASSQLIVSLVLCPVLFVFQYPVSDPRMIHPPPSYPSQFQPQSRMPMAVPHNATTVIPPDKRKRVSYCQSILYLVYTACLCQSLELESCRAC